MRRFFERFFRDDVGNVAPTVALSLVALIATGGLAFDYARVAGMDTELQTAADQAALAAATQLDGRDDARTRATAAANSLITHSTRFSSDSADIVPNNVADPADDAAQGTGIRIAQVIFYSAYTDPATKTVATDDDNSNYVEVVVQSRRANYAFTPIVRAFSGSTNARAVAGLGSAVCGVVPFFICNPTEPLNNTDVHLPPGGVDPGLGMVMYEGGTSWGPGNFGFLDQLGNGADGVAEALASNTLFGNCSATEGVTTKPGNFIAAVRDSLNMRMDFKAGNASACKAPPCSPSTNSTKDVVLPNGSTSCAWQQNPVTTSASMDGDSPPRYFPRAADADLPTTVTPQIMGYPRDRCHYFNVSTNNQAYPLCPNGRIGDGAWDRGAYFRANHTGLDWTTASGLDANGDGKVTRYETYMWEADPPNIATRLPAAGRPGNGAFTAYGQPQSQCLGPGGVEPNFSGADRRRITAAVVNCRRVAATTGLNGKKDLPVAGYIDVFLVEPVFARNRCPGCTVTTGGNTYVNNYADDKDIYVEVIGASGTGEGSMFPQISRRDVPRLID